MKKTEIDRKKMRDKQEGDIYIYIYIERERERERQRERQRKIKKNVK